ncbi:GNAT family N-acetyltransferase [Dehalococcoidia bacterium]|nr:GNAT family N-acetyltransferase [Dehalococcoidia bacterium]MCL0059717.1 GNAT family N-acetyltransferase [Dehalococcoidia bacterium]MCL0104565.1 GNAT family N-acetyltransferase [Dehalococcoidia bacterium]
MGIDLKSASRKDIDKLMPLFKGLYELYGGDIGPHFAEILQEYIDSENHLTMVALSDGAVVGVLVGSYRLDIDYECRTGFVDAIVVDEGFRKRGIGKRLLHHFAQWAQSKKCTVLQVLNGNREFFEHLGFEERPARLHQVSIERLST